MALGQRKLLLYPGACHTTQVEFYWPLSFQSYNWKALLKVNYLLFFDVL